MTTQDLKFTLSATGGAQVAADAQRASQSFDQLANTQAKVGITSGQMAQAMRMVPAQLTDITVGLATGQAPLTVLLQQGGQLKDMFGGITPAMRGVASTVLSLLSPVNVLAAGLGAVTYAAYQGAAESNQLNKALALTGGYVGITAGQFDTMAKRISASTNAAIGDTRELAAAAVSSGAFSTQSIGAVVSAMARLQSLTGASADSIVKDFAGMSSGVAAWAAEQNRQYHFLTVEQFKHIQALEKQRDLEGAMAVTAQALDQALAGRKPELGLLETSWNELGKAASRAWDAMKGVGRTESVDERIAEIKSTLDFRLQQSPNSDKTRVNQDLRAELAQLEAQKAQLDSLAAAKAQQGRKDATGIAALTDTGAQQRALQSQITTLSEQYKGLQGLFKEGEANIARSLRDGVLGQADAIGQRGALLQGELAAERVNLEARLSVLGRYANTEKEVAQLRVELSRNTSQAILAARRTDADAASAALAEAQADAQTYASLWMEAERVSQRLAEQTATGMAKLITDPLARARAEADISVRALERSTEQLRLNLQNAIDIAKGKGNDGQADELQRKLDELNTKQAGAAGGIRSSRAAEDFLSLTATTNFGAGFDGASQSLGTFTQSFGGLLDMYSKYNEAIKEAGTNETLLASLRDRGAQLQVHAYGDMAGAAKGFFEKGSKGYKVLSAAEQAFRAYELALAVGTAAQKIGLIGAVTSAKVAGDAAQSDSLVVSAAKQIAAFFGIGTASAAAGVANQAQGDPYTAWPRMAAMAAVMAGLGFATGVIGNKSGTSGSFAPTNTGTGTVFGDPSAESKSISQSIELLRDVDTLTMRYSAQMAASLKSIESNIGGLTSLLVQSGNLDAASAGVNTGFQRSTVGGSLLVAGSAGMMFERSMLGIIPGTESLAKSLPVIGGIVNGLMGLQATLVGKIANLFGSKSSVVGTGIAGPAQTLGSIEARGYDAYYYADVLKKEKFFGVTTGTSSSTQYTAADGELERQFALVLNGFGDAVEAASGPLGVSLATVTGKLNSFVVDIGRINLQGLTGDQINERLTAVFSAAGDNIAKAALPGFADFQKIGEGYLQTVVRVASGTEQASLALRQLGVSAVSLSALANKQGDVAAELVRQSLVAAETTTTASFRQSAGSRDAGVSISDRWVNTVITTVSGIGDIISTLDGSAQDIADAYKALTDVRTSLTLLGLSGEAVTRSLIVGAGSLTALQDGIEAYTENFFSDKEQLSIKTARLRMEFSRLSLAMPATRDGFRSLVAGIDTSTAAGQELLGGLLPLANAFADITEAAKDAGKGLQEEIDRLRGITSAGAAESNYAALQARFSLATAQARAGDSTALGDLPGLSKSLSDALADMAADRVSLARQVAAIANSLDTTKSIVTGGSGGVGVVSADAQALIDATTASTGAAAVANQTAASQADMLAELKALRQELQGLRGEQQANGSAVATRAARLVQILERITPSGDAALVRLTA